jgi:hypothetical protein
MPILSSGMIARVNPSNVLYCKIQRDMIIDGGNIRGVGNNTPVVTDVNTSQSAISSQTMDVTVDNYFYLSVSLSDATENVRLEAVEIKNI